MNCMIFMRGTLRMNKKFKLYVLTPLTNELVTFNFDTVEECFNFIKNDKPFIPNIYSLEHDGVEILVHLFGKTFINQTELEDKIPVENIWEHLVESWEK